MKTATASRVGWIALGLSWVLAACHSGKETTCGPGTELVAHECVPPLTDAGQAPAPELRDAATRSCGEGTIELDGRCQALKPIGAACDSGIECASGGCLSEARGAVGGYCTIAGCSENRQCPAGSHCTYSSKAEMTVCLAYCDDDDDCRAGDYVCQPLYTSDVHVCAPSCTISDACPSGTRCDAESGKCAIHECDPVAEDACGAQSWLLCQPDRRGLTEAGGVCLPLCSPQDPSAVCDGNEVCQPLPEDPTNFGVCAPPLCAATSDCPAGAMCVDGVCQPPARCDAEAACADETAVCVGGAGGQCMPACPSESECADIHAGLSCSAALGACLPTGSFPGSACRSDLESPCDPLSVRRDDGSTSETAMSCENGTCLARCEAGGDASCEAISETLTCAQDVFDAPVCLPKGSFPGGPCDAQDACAPLVRGETSSPVVCERDQCLITCDDGAGGDVMCAGIDASLLCAADLFAQDVCLPRGSIPGGPCAAGDSCAAGMACEGGMCLYDCTAGGQAVCDAMSSTLACSRTVYDTPVCLPKGSFPGAPCGAGNTCATDLMGLDAVDMACVSGRCVVMCASPGPFADGDALCTTVNPALMCMSGGCVVDCEGDNEALCGAIDPALTCVSNSENDFCAIACVDGMCPSGTSCLTSQNACLPTGTFLGSPCAGGTTCSGDPMLVCVPGETPRCAAGCTTAETSSPYCVGVGTNYGTGYQDCTDVGGGLLICT